MSDRGIGRLAALVLLVLSACIAGGCGEGTRQAPVAAAERDMGIKFEVRPYNGVG
jgi:hypothetical protein